MEKLISNFNSMIVKLKDQQQKLLHTERMEAWESIARKLAHEIKNPLTPIQLTIDNLRSKYEDENDAERLKLLEELNNFLMQIEKNLSDA